MEIIMAHKHPCLETKELDAWNASFHYMDSLELLLGLPYQVLLLLIPKVLQFKMLLIGKQAMKL